MTKPVILTGIRANNDLTIGNYFGAILPIIDMAKSRSNEYQINMFIPDLHSFTTPIDHAKLQEQIIGTARLFAAAGLPLDNDSIFMYRQSYVPAHSELAIILNSFTGMGEMGRMTQFKDKSASLNEDRVSVGLFDYPVLMASDILLYDAMFVPVGDDQTQHLEFTRDIAERINSRFGDVFTVPKPVKQQHAFFGKDQGLRIMDLQNPSKKMSKSDESEKGVIFLSDSPEVAAKKIMSAATDDKASIKYDPENQPGVSNLLQILALLENAPVKDVAKRFDNQSSYGEFKSEIADKVQLFLENFQTALRNTASRAVLSKLSSSEEAMNKVANKKLSRVQQLVGLRK